MQTLTHTYTLQICTDTYIYNKSKCLHTLSYYNSTHTYIYNTSKCLHTLSYARTQTQIIVYTCITFQTWLYAHSLNYYLHPCASIHAHDSMCNCALWKCTRMLKKQNCQEHTHLQTHTHNFHNGGLQKETTSKSPLKFMYPMVSLALKMRLYGLKQAPWQMVPKVQFIYEVMANFLNQLLFLFIFKAT